MDKIFQDTGWNNTNPDKDVSGSDNAPIVGNIKPGSEIRIKYIEYSGTKLYIDNTGVTTLHFYVSDGQSDKMHEPELILRPGEKITFLPGMNGLSGKAYLFCYNPDESENGQYFVNELIND